MSNETLPPTGHPLVRLLPPCDHNAWNNARMKGKTASLTCRFCPAKVKATNLMEIVCPEFRQTGRCPLSVSCPYLHIYRQKHKEFAPITFVVDPVLRRAALEIITSRSASNRVWPSDILIDIQQRVAQISIKIVEVQNNNSAFSALHRESLSPAESSAPDLLCGRPENASAATCDILESSLSGAVNPHRFDLASQSLLPPPPSPIAVPMVVPSCDSLPSAALAGLSMDPKMAVTGRYVPQQRSIRQRQQEEEQLDQSDAPCRSSSRPFSSPT